MAPTRWRTVPVTTGVVLLASMPIHLWRGGPAELTPLHVGGILLTVGGPGVGLLLLGMWNTDGPTPETASLRLGAWMGGSALVFLGVGIVTVFLGSVTVRTSELLEVLHVNGSVGLFVGFVMGRLEARGLATAERAAKEEARANALRAERERSEKLNDLLRHYILNGVAVIDGYAATIGRVDPDHESHVAVIRDRAESMSMLVKNVHALTVEDDPVVGTVDLQQSLREVVDERDDHRISMEPRFDPTRVRAGDSFHQAIRLLVDALLRVTDKDGAVEIGCEPGDDTVRILVSGRPGALSKPLRDSVFEPVTAGVGLQLYLVAEFLDPYGSVEVLDTGVESAEVAFAIDLDRAGE